MSSSFLKANFVIYKILGWQYFIVSSMNVIPAFGFHGLEWIKKKLPVNLIENPLYRTRYFFLVAFQIFYFFVLFVFNSLITMCFSVGCWVYLTFHSLSFLYVYVDVGFFFFYEIRVVSPIYLNNIFPLSFFILVCLMASGLLSSIQFSSYFFLLVPLMEKPHLTYVKLANSFFDLLKSIVEFL